MGKDDDPPAEMPAKPQTTEVRVCCWGPGAWYVVIGSHAYTRRDARRYWPAYRQDEFAMYATRKQAQAAARRLRQREGIGSRGEPDV